MYSLRSRLGVTIGAFLAILVFRKKLRRYLCWFTKTHSTIKLRETMPPPSKLLFPDHMQNKDGLWLKTTSWRIPRGVELRGVVVIIHGYAEHSLRYGGLAKHLNSKGFDVHSFDHQGHGQSEGDPLHVEKVEDYVLDAHQFAEQVQAEYPGFPMFCFGHSMGGMISILLCQRFNSLFRGAVFSGPLLVVVGGADKEPLRTIGKIVASILPKAVVDFLKTEEISSVPVVIQQNLRDWCVRKGGIQAHWAKSIIDSTFKARAQMQNLKTPFFAYYGENDRLCDPTGLEHLKKAASSDKKTHIFPNCKHEVHLEVEVTTRKCFEMVSAWYLERTPVLTKKQL